MEEEDEKKITKVKETEETVLERKWKGRI